MAVDGNPAAVVGDPRPARVRPQLHLDGRGVAVDDLVDGVVQDLPDQMMEAAGVHAADVHRRPAPDRIEALQDGDVLRLVAARAGPSGSAGGERRATVVPSGGPGGANIVAPSRGFTTAAPSGGPGG